MTYQALARKWRPHNFAEVIGQSHVVRALSNALDNQRVHHAFLFTGTRGVGKTTLARIFAKALNCQQGISSNPCGECDVCTGIDEGRFIDLIEVDAASRTKVDDTRELLDNVQYTPTLGRYKVYLIDEVHMLSGHSFNALLKTLEEPPEHVKFLLATTDPQKLPTTILSRCIQFNLKALDMGLIAAQLEKILELEKIEFDSAATLLLARSANGSVRDALSLLDQAIAFGDHKVETESVRTMLGMIDDRFTLALLDDIAHANAAAALDTISAMSERSVDFSGALDELLTTLHNLALFHVSPQTLEYKGIDSVPLHEVAEQLDPDWVQLLFQTALICKRDLALAPDPRSGFEMAILRMICFQPQSAEQAGAEQKPRQSAAAGLPVNKAAGIAADRAKVKKVDRPAPEKAEKPQQRVTEPEQPAPAVTDKPVVSESAADLPAVAPASSSELASSPDQDWLVNICKPDKWAEFVRHARFSGMLKELVYNLVPRHCSGNQLTLDLDQDARHLLSTPRIRKLEQQCLKSLGIELRIDIEVKQRTDSVSRTLAQSEAEQKEQQQRQAEQAFSHDPNVQELVDRFDAEIIPESVQPGQNQTGQNYER